MSGIAGVVYSDLFQIDHVLDTMLQTLKHRGAENWDIWRHKNLHVGTRGQEIFHHQKKEVTVLLDGFIANEKDIRSSLKLPQDSSLQELIAHAYDEWGIDCLDHLDGHFVIAIYDKKKQLLHLARDRMGAKPIYWYYENDTFVFASEMKALLAGGIPAQTPSLEGLAAYLRFGYLPQDMSPIESISKLLPGYCLTFSFTQGITIHSYWSYSSCFTKPPPSNLQEASLEMKQRLLEATSRCLPKNQKEIGCFLSGGIGSASVAHSLTQTLSPQQSLQAFTVGFSGQNDADVNAATAFTRSLSIPQITEGIHPGNFLDNFIKILWHLDEPLSDPNAIMTWNLAQISEPHTPIVFSGMGSDELFAGHNRYTRSERHLGPLQTLFSYFRPAIRKVLLPILKAMPTEAAYSLLKELKTDPKNLEYFDHNSLFTEKELAKAAPSLKNKFALETFINKFHHLSRLPSSTATYGYLDIKTRLPDCYMLQYDRLTAAFGLDWRSPFFDRQVVEWAATFSHFDHVVNKETAFLLKHFLKGVYPKEPLYRPKKSRPYFLSPWVKQSELPTIFHLLNQGTLVETGFISSSWLKKSTDSLDDIHKNFRHLWAILTLEVWFRLFINFPVDSNPPNISLIDLLSDPHR